MSKDWSILTIFLEPCLIFWFLDRYPKLRSKTLSNGARIVGIAKGAGMIEPNMATMLSYIMTDAEVPKESLQSMLATAVNGSFNSISVDGDESTSDTAVILSSNKIKMDKIYLFNLVKNEIAWTSGGINGTYSLKNNSIHINKNTINLWRD